ncbi:MAG: DUF2914 domain-containing protein [Nitrospirae bacterium]|nr:MAG: DUF2914 domain-containing protein [Nitrospirota bacterium]
MRWSFALFFISAVLFYWVTPSKALEVKEAYIAKAVVELKPVEPSEQFSSDIGRVYCFSRITGAKTNTTVRHLWFYKDRFMAEVELPVKSPDWRTYSSKRILPSWKGPWRVDITDREGLLLKSLHFEIE